MVNFTCCCFFILTAVFLCCAQEPRITSPPETVGVYVGHTAVLKCQVANLGNKMLRWSSLTHDFVIYEGGQLLVNDVTKYLLINTADGQVNNLQISNVEKSDQGFYQCAVEGTSQQIITHLDVIDAPELTMPLASSINMTDCCVSEKVTDSCLPACLPSIVDLDEFNTTACATMDNLKGLSKCFTAGSNHDNCCLNLKVDPLCLGFCHNVVPSPLTAEHYSKCFTVDTILGIFTCFELGFEFLPSEPTEVSAMVYLAGTARSILVKWSPPKKNPHRVTGYRILYKSRNQTSYNSVMIKDINARTHHLNEDQLGDSTDIDYKVRVTALADHGVSFGSVEVDIYFPSSTLPAQLNTDIDSCCFNRSVDEKCRNLLCDSRTWSKFNTDHILTCFPYLDDVFTCLVGERNHTNCCAAFDVASDCLPLCSGQPPPLSNALIGCVNQMSIIEACVQQGYGKLPTPPTQVTITSVETTSAMIQFQPSSSNGLTHYLVGLRKGNENAVFEYNMTVAVSEHIVHLNDLIPNTYYWLRIISVGESADSLPSETVSFLTYPEDYDSKPEPVTNVPHNMTECCINTDMPEICWRGCEYRSNITSYYKDILQPCFMHIGSVLTCAADGRDHSECCVNQGVKPDCVGLCAHTKKGPIDERFIACVPDTSKVIICFKEGIVNLPRHPDVVVFNVSKNSISLKWEQPQTSGKIDYFAIYYGNVGSEKSMVSTNKTFYILQNLQPSTPYEISVTSSNINGTSPPSPVITEYTLSDDIETPTYNRTEISGRALWVNISHCCESNFQDVCLKQCLNEQSTHPQQTACIEEGHKMLACFADGKDHRLCCERKNLPSSCIPICGGHALTTEISMATCMSYTHREIILSCYLENRGLIPGTPNNFGAKLNGTRGSVRLQWSTPENCGTDCTYGVHYWQTDPISDVKSFDNITNTFIVLEVTPDNLYTFTVTAQNKYGSSSPSAWQTLFIINYERNVKLFLDSTISWVEQRQPAKLICEKFGYDPDGSYKIEWFFNNRRKLENSGKMELMISSVDPATDEGLYTCTVIDSEISSSDSLFLPIKYAPKFSHFELQTVEPGIGNNAQIACLFHGLPDSDPKIWLKDGKSLTQEMIKYTMNGEQNYVTGLTEYSLSIADVMESDYQLYSLNVSNAYGHAECHVNLTNPTNIPVIPPKGKPDVKQCCINNDVNELCLELCGFHINITAVAGDSKYLTCLKYFKTYISCGADGRDHSKCCQKEGVLPMCIPLCSGEVPAELENSPKLIECLADHTVILSCAQQGHLLLPYAPENVTLRYIKADNIILVRWNEPHNSEDTVDHYNLYYNYSGNPIPRSASVNGLMTEYHIKNVQPQTVYNVWMTAGNQNGNSLATVIMQIDTSTDNLVSVRSEGMKSNTVAIGVGVTVAIIAFLAIVFVILFFLYRSRFFPRRGNSSVTFENPGFGNQGQVKIQGVEDQYSYGRLNEDPLSEVNNAQDSSSSAADSSFENPGYKLQQSNIKYAAVTLPTEFNS